MSEVNDRPNLGNPRDPMVRKFWEFHHKNPHVYEGLKSLAMELRQKGAGTYGMKSLFEVLRWHHFIKTSDRDFLLNNNYTSFYARLLMHNEQALRGFFQLRKACSDPHEANF